MSKAYSSDLRNRVIKCFIAKMKHADIAEKLDISLITIRKYSIKYKKEGKIEFKKEVEKQRLQISKNYVILLKKKTI